MCPGSQLHLYIVFYYLLLMQHMYKKHGVAVKHKPSYVETILLRMLSLSSVPCSLGEI